MVRLKYTALDNLLYTDWFTLGPNFVVKGIINTRTYHFQIVEFNSELVYEGQAKDLRQAKAMLKNQLVSAGVNFEGEIRSK